MSFLTEAYEDASPREEFFKDGYLVSKLYSEDCLSFIESEIETFVKSSTTNKFNSGLEKQYSFLRGTIYGYVYGKSGDKKFAVSSAELAVNTAIEHQVHGK